MAPLVGIVIDPAALAKYVLQTGFDVKNPEKFIMQQQTPQDAGSGFRLRRVQHLCRSVKGPDTGRSRHGSFRPDRGCAARVVGPTYKVKWVWNCPNL